MESRVLVIILATLLLLPDFAAAQELNGSKAVSSQELLPASTKAWLSIPDSKRLDEKFLETQLGKMSKDEKFSPFMDEFRAQLRQWMNEKNVRLGLNFDEVQDIRSGEICIAGILPAQPLGAQEKLGRGSHGLVILVDVSNNIDEANELMGKINKDLVKRGAVEEDYEDVFGAEVTKWKFPKKKVLENQRFAFQTITDGWLLSSDNEAIFRQIVRRLGKMDNAKAGETLASQVAFQNVMKTVHLDNMEAQIYWYVNPFGYLQLAQAIAREKEEFRQSNNDDWARILKKIGFDGFKGVGGFVGFATGQHEILHRTFVYKPTNDQQDVKQKRVFGLFDFENKKKSSLAPPSFIPDTVSGYFCASWNMQRALKNVGYAIDTFAKKPGTFEDTLESLREQMNVDVTQVVSKFDNEFMIVSESTEPTEQNSEKITIGIRSIADPNDNIKSLEDSWPHQHETKEYKSATDKTRKIVRIDDSIGSEELELDDDIFGDPDLEEEEEEEEAQFSIFEDRFCSATEDFLFVANNEANLKKVLDGPTQNPLVKSQDYRRVAAALDQMSDKSRISFRQFSRLDRVIRPNYEMMRAGKMAASDTILARLINHLFKTRNKDKDAVRVQKIDGSMLPADFENDVAPYFGPSGWVMETTYEGWLFSGVVLERSELANQVVKKENLDEQTK